jgi:membrane fusion protein (multidrug efflux system)
VEDREQRAAAALTRADRRNCGRSLPRACWPRALSPFPRNSAMSTLARFARLHPSASAFVLGLAVVAFAGCDRKPSVAPSGPPPKPAVTVVATTERTLSDTEEFVGEIRGLQDVEIRARVQGYLEGIHFDPGTPVKKGQLLFTIDARPFQAAVAQAKAAQTQAQVEATRSKADAERFTDLATKGLVPRKQGDDARAQAEAAQANLQAARAVVRAKEVDLGYTRITSPINGRAGLVNPAVGNVVGTPSEPPLTVVSDLTSVRVRFSVGESTYLRVFREREEAAAAGKPQPQTPPRLLLSDGSLYPLPGRIVSIDRNIDAKTGSLVVEAEFANPDGLLRPGQFARIKGEVGSLGKTLVIPQRAVVLVQGVPTVYVIGANDVAEQRRLEGAAAPGGLFKVSSGLAAGERVVVDGQLKIKPGVAVTANEIALDRAIGGAGVPDAAVGGGAPGAAPAAAGGAGTTPAAATPAR